MSKPHPVKVTALAYIREAVQKHRFEEIPDLAEVAYEFGADVWEVREALIGIGRRQL